MFDRAHHQRILRLLHALDADLLARAHCWFGGGTAIVLLLGEYRESRDIDFLCSDREGYRLLRNAIAPPTLGSLLRAPIRHLRDVRTQRDKISTFLEVDDTPVRVEFILEGRITLAGDDATGLPVPVLARDDMYAEKLLANADRALDRSQMSRDLIDLAMMIRAWGPIPETALAKARAAYGPAIDRCFDAGLALLRDNRYRDECLRNMAMDAGLGNAIIPALETHRPGP